MSIIMQMPSTCPLCSHRYKTDQPSLISAHGGGFYADLQPGYSAPASAVWEALLFSCPECGYTTYGPAGPEDPPPPAPLAEYVRRTFKGFVERQKQSIMAEPSLTSKYELYALQLDFLGADDQLIADQFLRASWSARIRGRAQESRRLRSLAASRYEKSRRSAEKHILEEEVLIRYLLVELYRLLGEEGRRMVGLEELLSLRGESIQADCLIDTAERQAKEPHEDEVLRAEAGMMDFLGHYRGLALVTHGYVTLQSGNLSRARFLFGRVLGFCEGPLRTRLFGPQSNVGMTIDSHLESHGAQAAIGLREVLERQGEPHTPDRSRLEYLINAIERKWGVSATEVARHNTSRTRLPPKSGWRYLSRSKNDPQPRAVVSSTNDEYADIPDLLKQATEDCRRGAYESAASLGGQVVARCTDGIEGSDRGTREFLELSRLRGRGRAIQAMARLGREELNPDLIRDIEAELRDYYSVGGPKTNATFALLLSLLELAFRRKRDPQTAQAAADKAAELTEDDAVARFHWGRQLLEFPPTGAAAQSVLLMAMHDAVEVGSWVEGAAALELVRWCAEQSNDDRAIELLQVVVKRNYVHAPSLLRFDFIRNCLPKTVIWIKQFMGSAAGERQFRPSWRSKTWGDTFFSQLKRMVRSDDKTYSSQCIGCRRGLPYTPGNKLLAVAPDAINRWLESAAPLGLACSSHGVYGACCWTWHTFEDWNTVDCPQYVPICPRCSEVLYMGD